MRTWVGLVLCGLVAACGSSSGPAARPAGLATIDFDLTAGGWAGRPVTGTLEEVSNNGAGYTGEIHVYTIIPPADGRLQVSLAWEHDADFDVLIADDPAGQTIRVRADNSGQLPEYVGLPVFAHQVLYILVAGWMGDPGDYVLETVLLPSNAPVFALDEIPNFTVAWPRNAALVFRFNVELEPQDISDQSVFAGLGLEAEGLWCIDGRDLIFYPDLPQQPGEEGGLRADRSYTLQFPPGALGLRAVTGEYLSELISFQFETGDYVDERSDDPPHVTDVDWNRSNPWDGSVLAITIVGVLDPNTVDVQLTEVHDDGTETTLPVLFALRQEQACFGTLLSRISLRSDGALPPASTVRIRLPGTIRGIAASQAPDNFLEEGAGFSVDYDTP